jgi:pimeloyl-ACP methyl ester carboxylesterase
VTARARAHADARRLWAAAAPTRSKTRLWALEAERFSARVRRQLLLLNFSEGFYGNAEGVALSADDARQPAPGADAFRRQAEASANPDLRGHLTRSMPVHVIAGERDIVPRPEVRGARGGVPGRGSRSSQAPHGSTSSAPRSSTTPCSASSPSTAGRRRPPRGARRRASPRRSRRAGAR